MSDYVTPFISRPVPSPGLFQAVKKEQIEQMVRVTPSSALDIVEKMLGTPTRTCRVPRIIPPCVEIRRAPSQVQYRLVLSHSPRLIRTIP